MLRRVIFIVIVFYVSDYPFLQIQLIQFLTIITIIYIRSAKSLYDRNMNRLEFINETFTIIVQTHLFLFTDFINE